MTITKTLEGDTLTIRAEGWLDTMTAPQFHAAVQELEAAEQVVLDLGGVDYISSAGLRMLLALQKKMMTRDGMKLIGVNDDVNDVFEVTGFDEILTYEKR